MFHLKLFVIYVHEFSKFFFSSVILQSSPIMPGKDKT